MQSKSTVRHMRRGPVWARPCSLGAPARPQTASSQLWIWRLLVQSGPSLSFPGSFEDSGSLAVPWSVIEIVLMSVSVRLYLWFLFFSCLFFFFAFIFYCQNMSILAVLWQPLSENRKQIIPAYLIVKSAVEMSFFS